MSAAGVKGLCKGLSALMGEEYSLTTKSSDGDVLGQGASSPYYMPISTIHSGALQPRTRFNEDYLKELSDSIKKNGIMQPIIVRSSRDNSGKYEIIAGERRWRAAQLAGLDEVPVIIREMEDAVALEIALVENIQRQDLTPLEEAMGYQRLMDEFAYTQEHLARTLGKSRSHIANLLRLLALPDAIKALLDKGDLTMGHARALLNAENAVALAQEIIEKGLNVRQTEALVRQGTHKPEAESPANTLVKIKHKLEPQEAGASSSRPKDSDILALEHALSESIGLSVSINDRGSQKGDVVISYQSLTQLDEILRRLGGAF